MLCNHREHMGFYLGGGRTISWDGWHKPQGACIHTRAYWRAIGEGINGYYRYV